MSWKEFLKRRFNKSSEVEPDLKLVVDRLHTVLPKKVVLQLFTKQDRKNPNSPQFPYCRVDNELSKCIAIMQNINHYGWKNMEEFRDFSLRSSTAIGKAIIWTEIGFAGIEQLAVHQASRNWTTKVGHTIDDTTRAKYILQNGKPWYEQCVRDFIMFRKRMELNPDFFVMYDLEYLLDKFEQ